MRILAAMPNKNDGTSFYRAAGPIIALEKFYPEFQFTFGEQEEDFYNWPTFMRHDVLFFQRPSNYTHLDIIKHAKDYGLKIWIDYDDHLLDVPSDNPAHETYNTQECKSAIRTSLSLADVVTTSTETLSEFMGYQSKTIVVPNAFNDTLFQKYDFPMKNKRVLWRGSPTHQGDLIEYKDAITQVIKENPESEFVFLGYNPWFITRGFKNCKFIEWTNQMKYFQVLQFLRPSIAIVPLIYNDFNKAKSNIAWIESTWAGASVLAPSMAEWSIHGICNYTNQESFYIRLTEMIKSEYNLNQKISWKYIEENLKLTHINKMRVEILRGLKK